MSTAAAIAEALLDLKRQMRQHLDEILKASGLSFARYKVLMVLERLGPCRPGEIAEQLRHAPRTLTDALDGLERDGLVRREPHPQDRRALLVHLTEQGRQALDQAKVPRAQALDMVFAPLDASEQAQLLAYLERVRIRN